MKIQKKANLGNQMMFFLFIFMLLLIGVGIVAGAVMYYGSDYDLRLVEAEILNLKVRNCIMINGIDDKLIEGFFEKCLINKSVVENNKLMIRICENVVNKEECMAANEPIFQSGTNFQVCGFIGSSENENFPKCAFSTFSSGDGKNYMIITSSNQKIMRRNV